MDRTARSAALQEALIFNASDGVSVSFERAWPSQTNFTLINLACGGRLS